MGKMALISKRSETLVQQRVKNEEFNVKTYTAMANWCDLHGYEGSAKQWRKYAEDELQHKQWACQFLLDLNILPIESSQDQPQTEFKGLPQIIALTYQREVQTTNECQELAKVSMEENDFLTFGLAQKYMNEQVEELAKAQMNIDKLEAFGDDPIALRLLDNEFGA